MEKHVRWVLTCGIGLSLLILLSALLPSLAVRLQDVLIMQNCVRELLSKSVFREIVLNSSLDDWDVQNLSDAWSGAWCFLKALLYNIFERERVCFWKRRVPIRTNRNTKLSQIAAEKGWS